MPSGPTCRQVLVGVGDGCRIAGVSVCDGVGSGSASVGMPCGGVGEPIEGITPVLGAGAADAGVVDGRGRWRRGGLVETTGTTVAGIRPGLVVVGFGNGLGTGIPRADSPAVPGRAEVRPASWGRCRTWMDTADSARKAIARQHLVDPSGTTPGTILNVLDQTSTTIPLPMADQSDAQGNVGAAFNPLANLAVTVNEITGDALVIDPNAPSVLTAFKVGGVRPVDVAIDPVSDIAVFVNQGSGTASVFSLGQLRPLHVLQASVTTPGGPSIPIVSGPSILINSTLSTPAAASPQTLTLIGNGFTVNSQARLDGVALATAFVSPRELTATVSPSFQSAPRRYALDVADSGVVSNATSFTVVESVNVGVGNGNTIVSAPSPQGVAIDPQLNRAVVTDSGLGCNQVYLIDLASGTLDGDRGSRRPTRKGSRCFRGWALPWWRIRAATRLR